MDTDSSSSFKVSESEVIQSEDNHQNRKNIKQRRCVVCGMKKYVNGSEDFTTVWHRFPSDAERKKLWCEKIGKESVSTSSTICSNHFTEEDYIYDSKVSRRLKKKAVPFVTKSIDSDKSCGKPNAKEEIYNIYFLDDQQNVYTTQHLVLNSNYAFKETNSTHDNCKTEFKNDENLNYSCILLFILFFVIITLYLFVLFFQLRMIKNRIFLFPKKRKFLSIEDEL